MFIVLIVLLNNYENAFYKEDLVTTMHPLRDRNLACFSNLRQICKELAWTHFSVAIILGANRINDNLGNIYDRQVNQKRKMEEEEYEELQKKTKESRSNRLMQIKDLERNVFKRIIKKTHGDDSNQNCLMRYTK